MTIWNRHTPESHDYLIGSHECLLLFTPSCCGPFTICSGLWDCSDVLRMCVLYVIFGSKVRQRTFRCVAMDIRMLFNLRSRLLIYSAGSGENKVHVVCLHLV